MRHVPAGLKAHLDGQATTTCRCWRLTRGDGQVLGFTDHDAAIAFDATRFEAATGLFGSEAEAELGLASGTQEIEGALSSLAISEQDIAAGRYDGARIEIFLVNWQDAAERLLLDVAELGEVKRSGTAFAAELRGIAADLDRRRGRVYRRRCDAVLGDARCKVDVGVSPFVEEGVVDSVGDESLVVSVTNAIDVPLFEHGRLSLRDGIAGGLAFDLASLRKIGTGRIRLTAVGAMPDGVAAGNRVRLHAGCDKTFATCRSRFANGLNFCGFPHLPGNDIALRFAKRDGLHDGAPVVP